MTIFRKLVILCALFIGTTVLDRTLLASQGLGLPDLVQLLLYLCAYLVLLYFEIRSRLSKSASHRQLRWMGFHFTFWVVVLWFGIYGSNLVNEPSTNLLTYVLDSIQGILVFAIYWGLLSGLVGMAIAQFMVLFVFKQTEQI